VKYEVDLLKIIR